MRILEKLWYGNINPQGRDIQKDSRMKRALFLVVKCEYIMRAMVSDTQKEQFEKSCFTQHSDGCCGTPAASVSNYMGLLHFAPPILIFTWVEEFCPEKALSFCSEGACKQGESCGHVVKN